MGYIRDFIKQKTPKSGKALPTYFQKALVSIQVIMAAYFLMNFFLLALTTSQWMTVPIVMFVSMILLYFMIDRINVRIIVLLQTLSFMLWCGWYVHMLGWGVSSQHLLIPALTLVFFNIYEFPTIKIVYFFILLIYRMLLYAYANTHDPVFALMHSSNVMLQMLNSTLLFISLGTLYVLFSSSIQNTERQLLIDNQELHKEAGTDPLTRLPNRRAMLDEIEVFRKANPEESFCIAIADIDFFKKVNDTYGHNCGDYTLKELSKTFVRVCENRASVCRWGGEEFCFFLPSQNIDEAGIVMHDVHFAVSKMPLHFEDIDFSITITIGVEEYDFESPLEAMLDKADRKLYMGKVSGRNRVVI